jgi:hypothetical protein
MAGTGADVRWPWLVRRIAAGTEVELEWRQRV